MPLHFVAAFYTLIIIASYMQRAWDRVNIYNNYAFVALVKLTRLDLCSAVSQSSSHLGVFKRSANVARRAAM